MKNVKTNQMNARRCNSEGAGVKMTSWLNNNFKLLALTLLAMLSVNVWGQSTTYTSNVTFNAGANGSACKVTISSTSYDGMKLGTSSKTGTMTFTIPEGTTKIHIHAAKWNGESGNLNISASVGTLGSSSIALTADAGVSGNSPFTLSKPALASTTYYFEISISNVTAQSTITLTTSTKRAVVWGVNTEAAASLSSISVKTAPSKTTYTEGDKFDPTGLVITKTYSDASTEDWAYASHASDFTFSPTTSAALTTSNTSVTITVGGKSTTQTITVNAKPKHTVKFYNAGEVVKTVSNVVDGTLFSAIKPTIGTGAGQLNIESCDNSSTHFMGWTTESFQKRGNAPSYVADNDAINDDMELRAVWAKEDEE